MNPDLAPRRTQRDTEKCKREKQNIWYRYKGKIVTRKSEACHSEEREATRNLADPRAGPRSLIRKRRGFGMTAKT